MNETTRNCMITAAAVLIFGLFLSCVLLYLSDLDHFPSRLADIYREDRISLTSPGSREVQLNRTGVYGIYYQYSLMAVSADSVQYPPVLTCTLKSESGQLIKGVADYEPTNRYWSKKGGGPAILIQSITVEEPGEYTFRCVYQDDNMGPEVSVSLGPNYTWEFIRLALKSGPVLISIILSLTGSFLVSTILIMAGIFHIKDSEYSEG